MMQAGDAKVPGMRTTVNLPEDLLRDAKLAATRSGRSLSDVVADGVRLLLSRQDHLSVPVRPALPVFGGSGLRPGVDLEDKDGLAELLAEPAGSHAPG